MLQPIKLNRLAGQTQAPLALYNIEATRTMERLMAEALPPHTLMARAGASIAALAKAIAPHAQTVWVACGPGNNGGDGLVAAALLQPWANSQGVKLLVSWCGDEHRLPADACFALKLARDAGVQFTTHPPDKCDLAIDALLGLGARTSPAPDRRAPTAQELTLDRWQAHLQHCAPTLLCVDTPTGLNPETGEFIIAENRIPESARAIFCLTFIVAKPGLFTADGRDRAGQVWLDDLGWHHMAPEVEAQAPEPTAWLGIPESGRCGWQSHADDQSPHNTHKGHFGDVWVLGGQGLHPTGVAMAGAAMLAAIAALHAHAGRVFAVMLDGNSPSWDARQPELMLRSPKIMENPHPLPTGCWVCGCGGGEAVAPFLPKLLAQADALVLDADALNTLAGSPALQDLLLARSAMGKPTVLTPHPLEAARLLGISTAQVQADRLAAARRLASTFQCVCVLKGSGTVLASPSGLLSINPSGNARLSTAGTGDVLAGMVGAALATRALAASDTRGGQTTGSWLDEVLLPAVAKAVFKHGDLADNWPIGSPLTASELARQISPAASSPPAAR